MTKVKVKTYIPKVNQYIKQLGLEPKGTVQKLIDSEIVKLSDPYAPSDTTALRESVFMNTDIGSGKIIYDIYGNSPGRNTWNDTTSKFQDRGSDKSRGPFWVLRMWNDGGKERVMLAVKRFLKQQ
jgi:hypothetical protein